MPVGSFDKRLSALYLLCRYDYEEVETEKANAMIEHLRQTCQSKELLGRSVLFPDLNTEAKIVAMDDFEYTDPIDASISRNQVRF